MSDEVELCDYCEEPVGEAYTYDFNETVGTGRYYCSQRCMAEDEQNRAEAAWESYLSRYYGGEIVTQEERYRTDWEAKRRM